MSNENLDNILNRDRAAEVNPQHEAPARDSDVQGPDISTEGTTTSNAEVSVDDSDAPRTLDEADDEDAEPSGAGQPTGTAPDAGADADPAPGDGAAEQDGADQRMLELEALVTERTSDLQRLQAEYVNYKKRVDRDRLLSRAAGVEAVVLDLVPVLDSIELARQHGDMGQGFQMVADALTKLAAKHGLTSFGAVGDPFDPTVHDALMEVPLPEGESPEVTTVSQVMQTGYKLGARVLRPARVGVANPA